MQQSNISQLCNMLLQFIVRLITWDHYTPNSNQNSLPQVKDRLKSLYIHWHGKGRVKWKELFPLS